MSTLLLTKNLQVKRNQHVFIDTLDLTCQAGEIWGILGINGVGKTTLLNTLTGLHGEYTGQICITDKHLKDFSSGELARTCGYLLQHFPVEFPQTVQDFCSNALHPHISRWKNYSEDDRENISKTLNAVELAGFEDRYLSTLSGGEKRRVEIASLLLQKPQVWLLDEPVSHLDLHHQVKMLELLTQTIRQQGYTAIAVLHDPNLAIRFCTHVLLLNADGTHQAGASTQLLTAENLSSLYNHPVLAIHDSGRIAFIAD